MQFFNYTNRSHKKRVRYPFVGLALDEDSLRGAALLPESDNGWRFACQVEYPLRPRLAFESFADDNPHCSTVTQSVEELKKAIHSALIEIRQSAGLPLWRVWIALSSNFVSSSMKKVSIAVENPASGVTEDDIENILDKAEEIQPPGGCETPGGILRFHVDKEPPVDNPLNLRGKTLTLERQVYVVSSDIFRCLVKTVNASQAEVEDVVCADYCRLFIEKRRCEPVSHGFDVCRGLLEYAVLAREQDDK
jgi:hypothetical protein